jgi:hypothetical protein
MYSRQPPALPPRSLNECARRRRALRRATCQVGERQIPPRQASQKKFIGSQHSGRGAAKGRENLVSDVVAKGVANTLETVEIEQQQHRRWQSNPLRCSSFSPRSKNARRLPTPVSESISQVFVSENHPLSCHCAEKIGYAKRKEHTLEHCESPPTTESFFGIRWQMRRARKRDANDKECRMNKTVCSPSSEARPVSRHDRIRG